jgi:hypothetical protein
MVDRIGLLTPRLAMAGPQQDLHAVDALGEVRVGLNMVQLLPLEATLENARVPVRPLLQALSEHFRNRPAQSAGAEPALLDHLDNTLRAVCGAGPSSAQREAVAALAGIRRGLFPDAAPWHPATCSNEERR